MKTQGVMGEGELVRGGGEVVKMLGVEGEGSVGEVGKVRGALSWGLVGGCWGERVGKRIGGEGRMLVWRWGVDEERVGGW